MRASPISLLLRSGNFWMVKVTQSSTSSSYPNRLTFPSYGGDCLAVIDKLSVSSVKPDDRPTLELASTKPSPSDDILFGFLRQTRSATTIDARCLGCLIPGSRIFIW